MRQAVRWSSRRDRTFVAGARSNRVACTKCRSLIVTRGWRIPRVLELKEIDWSRIIIFQREDLSALEEAEKGLQIG